MRNINKKTLGLLAILCSFGFQIVFAQDEDPLFVGYLVGGGEGEIINSYYNSGEENNGENGLATASMKIQGNYISWDFENRIWTFIENENNGYPVLGWQFPSSSSEISSSSSSEEALFVSHLVGDGEGEIINSYYDSGEESNSENMRIQDTYTEWDFENGIWAFVENENNGYPVLCWQFPSNCVDHPSSSSEEEYSSSSEEQPYSSSAPSYVAAPSNPAPASPAPYNPPSYPSIGGSVSNVVSSSSNDVSSSSKEDERYFEDVTFSFNPQIAKGSINVRTTFNAIVISNLPANTKIEVYNVQGKRIYLTISNSVASHLEIPIHAKGMYIVKTGSQSVRAVVK